MTDNNFNSSGLTDLNRNLCLICQTKKGKDETKLLSKLSPEGRERLLSCGKERQAALDSKLSQAIIRVLHTLGEQDGSNYVNHKSCYASFTSKSKIDALKEAGTKALKVKANPNLTQNPAEHITRSKAAKMDKTKCILCQKDSNEHLRLVMSANMDSKIMNFAKYDYTLHIRVSAVGDLIAADALYHSTCVLKFKKLKETMKIDEDDLKKDFAILPNLQRTSRGCVPRKGLVLTMDDVWKRYVELASDIAVGIPPSFESRRSTFKDKLESVIGHEYQFFQPLNRDIHERQMLLIPMQVGKKLVADDHFKDDDALHLPSYQPENEDFRTIVHAALRIRGDLKSWPGHSGFDISKESSVTVIPDSLHLFLGVLMQGEEILDSFADVQDDDRADLDDASTITQVSASNVTLSIAQDIVYAVSKGKKLTPKHIGLGLTLHQATRSKKLVNLFHAAGHVMSYRNILQADTTSATVTLQKFESKCGAVIPPNFNHADEFRDSAVSVLHVTADNINIMLDSLDGKKMFNATQMVAFQRKGVDTSDILRTTKLSKATTLHVPPELNELCTIDSFAKHEPDFLQPVDLNRFKASDPIDFSRMTKSVLASRVEDITFAVSRADSELQVGWTEFNKNTAITRDRSAVGYMPIILNPAHELATLSTVLSRCIAVGDGLGYKHIVLTVDQQLYCKLVEMQWSSEVFKERIILRMGGLHIAMNFLHTIGRHMSGSGLAEIWLESGILGEVSIKKVLEGKAYAKGMRAHKLTFQAFWRLLYPQIVRFLEDNHNDDAVELMLIADNPEFLRDYLQSSQVLPHLTEFLVQRCEEDKNFSLWWTYIDMVFILLMLTRGIRSGDWDCYLSALPEILPYTALYDHANYLKSLTVYNTSMHQLPLEIEAQFRSGEFGVLMSDQNKFAQVDPDHAQEWIVGTCKDVSGGIVGITEDVRTLQRWALSLHWRSEIAAQTFKTYGINANTCFKEESSARRSRDAADEDAILQIMETFEVLSSDVSDVVCNIATKDNGTVKITEALLCAKKRGDDLVRQFVSQRLVKDSVTGKATISYHATVPKNNALTLEDLHKEKPAADPTELKKAGRDFLHTLVVAYDAGRKIDLSSILKHELCQVPVSLALMSGILRSAEKASLVKEVVKDIVCPSTLTIDKPNSILIIDGMAFVNSLGRPATAKTFGDYSCAFNKRIESYAIRYNEVHVVFDRYRALSVKAATRRKRAKGFAPVRRVIKNCGVPLPKDWSSFLAMPDNKADLARFLCEEALKHDFGPLEVVLSGGFPDETHVASTDDTRDVSNLRATHEEADTRILHAVQCNRDNVVVSVRDTYVILLFIHHFQKMKCVKCWVMCGTARDRKYIPIHEVCEKRGPEQILHLMAFHAITGCDTTSKLASITKTGAWKTFVGDTCTLLHGLGEAPMSDQVLENVEKFVVQLYKIRPDVFSADAPRTALFGAVKKLEFLPPTSDALRLHIKRCHYQVSVWENAHLPEPQLPSPESCGWKIAGDRFIPVLMTIPPVPKACPEFNVCGCKGLCNTNLCGCRKAPRVPCMKLCRCKGQCLNGPDEDDDTL